MPSKGPKLASRPPNLAPKCLPKGTPSALDVEKGNIAKIVVLRCKIKVLASLARSRTAVGERRERSRRSSEDAPKLTPRAPKLRPFASKLAPSASKIAKSLN